TVTMPDGTEYPAEVVGRDAASDLAVLKISGNRPFPFVEFGDSRQARVGDWVVAIGNPFGLGGTVTSGIVSAVHRATGAGAYDRYIQTDASINRGNSGGPLFDMQGNVIGINNAIFSPSGGSVGIGFAIPAETASPIVDKLISGEEILRGYLGVRIEPMTEDLAEALGVAANRGEFIQSVQPGEPAEQAGILAGDVVLKVDGKEVSRDQTLSFIVANIQPGSRIDLELIRDGERRTIPVTVGRRPSEEELAAQLVDPQSGLPSQRPAPNGAGTLPQSLGVQAMPITPQIGAQLGVEAGTQGLVITDVDANSDAGSKGVTPGMLILGANGRSVASVADLEQIIASAKSAGREAVLLRLRPRNAPPVSIAVRIR
ncbi:MAG TPA: trypsin-like peptidase domain-containing protein, partial [Croceibacterium sp.]